jgi:hypothetical protein
MLKITLSLLICCTLFTGVLKASTIIDYIPNTTPDKRYTLHNDGTVTDTATGLQWQRCSLGQEWDGSTCTGTALRFNWSYALVLADRSRVAGYYDWRLANVEELSSIMASDRYNPAINNNIFPNTPSSKYWSSSPYADSSNSAWYVEFEYARKYFADRSNNDNAVRLVRGGQ